jgi:predicted ferric reductase
MARDRGAADDMDKAISGFFWISLYLLLVLTPVALMLVPPVPSGRGFWLELSVALGFIGLTQIAVQFILIARFKRVTAPYGIDIILTYHRQIAVLAILLLLAHPLIIVIDNPSRLKLLNPLGGNWASRFAWLSVLSLVAIAVTSIFRERLRLNYDHWRVGHLILGVAAIVFAQLHVSMAGLYTNVLWKQAVWVGIAVLMVGMVVYLRMLKPWLQRGRQWRVVEIRPEQADTYMLAIEAVGHKGIRFLPGQFAWLKLSNSPFTLREHPFSFCSSAERGDRLEFGIKALGDFTSQVKDIPIGTRAYIDGPHGAFSIDRYQAAGFVFIAGGVGITPFMSFLRTMADRHDPRPAMLIYAEKTWEDVAFRDELEALKKQVDLEIHYVIQNPPADWEGETGQLTTETLERRLPKEKYTRTVFLCGAPAMMKSVHDALIEHGVPEMHIQMEEFNLA